MKIRSRNLLTTVLAMLCAFAFAIGVSFMLPKNKSITADAAGGSLYDYSKDEFSMDALNNLAKAAGDYKNIYELIIDVLKNNVIIQGEKFGGSSVNFGKVSGSGANIEWIPVYVSKCNQNVVLTLMLKDSGGWLNFTDGTASSYVTEVGYPISNMYSTSYIHACINAGQTSSGYYAGSYTTTSCTMYKNDSASASGAAAPSTFTNFIEFTKNGKFSEYILPASATCSGGSYINDLGDTHDEYVNISSDTYNFSYTSWSNDNVWLPSVTEVGESGGGTWGTTISQNSFVGQASWLRSGNASGYALAHTMQSNGYYNGNTWGHIYAPADVRPAINVNISAITKVDEPKDVELVYNGSARTIVDVAADKREWYDSEIINLTYPEGMKDVATYKVKAELKADLVAAGVKFSGEPDTGAGESETVRYFDFKIKPLGISVPTVQNSTVTYKGEEYEFGLSGYDKDLMSVPTGGYTSNNGSSISWDETGEKFKATDAGEYTVKFHMDSKNHIWKTDSGESTTDQSKTITISKKELTINTSNSTTSASNPTFDFGTAGNMTVNAVASGISNPDFELNMYYIKDGDTANPLTTGVDATTNTLDVSQISSSGSYTLCVELTGATSNKNYSIANGKYEYAFTIGSGSIDFSVINWQYREGTGNASDLFVGGVQEVLRYKLDSGSAVKYYILADIAAGGYLSIDANYNSNGYTNGFMTTNASGATVQYADGVGKYKTRIALKTDADHKFKSGGSNNGSFGGDDLSGWYEIEWEISKGKIDQDYLDNLNKNLQYKVAGGSWQTYDPDNPPEYGNGAVEIRLNPAKYPDGVSGANITINNKNTNIGTYTAQVTLTTDTTNYEPVGTQTFQWRIAAQAIEVDWTSGFWTDVNGDNVLDDYGAPYQIKELNISDDLKQYVEYHYYLANSDLTMGAFVGVGDVGLEALKGAPHNASSNTPVDVYVKAVIKSGVTQYELKDPSGNDCATLFKLGDTKTLAKVSQTETEMEYGGDKLTGGIVSIIGEDTNAELSGNFIAGIYIYDAAGNNLGLLKDYDGTTAAVGVYTIKIVLTEAGEDTYTLTPGTTMKFTVKPKSIALPTLNEIVFNNTFIDVRDYMGGSWAEYKEIIKVGGTYDGVKNVGNYSLTLTITDGNYCWDYGTDATPSKAGVRNSLADSGVSWSGDETIAECGWAITPYVLKPGGWNLKGKDGAVYNIPAELTDGLDVGINYLYHTDKTGNALGEGDSLKAGSTYFVKAQLLGADSGNFIFEDSNAATSDFATYKIPQSGAAAFMNTVKDFMTGTWLGLPVWSWFLIGLALLILLIIIIVVAAKRRKSKEEREAKKAAKEEEKARREEERRLQQERLEEERRLQREKLEAEREMAKAKQEAELEKIRAQAQLSGAGIASVAAAVPQAVQQQQPQVQVTDNSNNELLREMREQMAELRADNKATQAQLLALQNKQQVQQPQVLQQPMYPQLPMQMPMQSYGGDAGTLARLEAQINAMQAEQRARYDAEQRIELAAFRAESHVDRDSRHSVDLAAMREHFNGGIGNYPQQQQGNPIDALGAIVAAALKTIGSSNTVPPVVQPAVAELPQQTGQSATVTAKYPPDAVVTTTTTVDTTKNNATLRRDENFDIDGFYDPLD